MEEVIKTMEIDLVFLAFLCVLIGWILGMITGMCLLLSRKMYVVYSEEDLRDGMDEG